MSVLKLKLGLAGWKVWNRCSKSWGATELTSLSVERL